MYEPVVDDQKSDHHDHQQYVQLYKPVVWELSEEVQVVAVAVSELLYVIWLSVLDTRSLVCVCQLILDRVLVFEPTLPA